MRTILSAAIAAAVALLPAVGNSYEIETHRAISRAALLASNADQLLVEELGIPEGVGLFAAGRSLLDWIAEGAAAEDGDPRYVRHFHDPLRPWNTAGLGAGPLRFQSSVLWGQDAAQAWSWPRARAHFLAALTAETREERDAAWALTFRGLGQLVHLVQDAASPAHTRNDPHPRYNFERAVRDLTAGQAGGAWLEALLGSRVSPGDAWAALPPAPLAPAPIARLIDADRYVGSNPDATMELPIGLGEYTNANFFSEDTTFRDSTPYPFPAFESVSQQAYEIDLARGLRVTRHYHRKDRDGDSGYRLAAVSLLTQILTRYQVDPVLAKHPLDEHVYRDYAERLLPRAAGYSTALIDHFFRGRLLTRLALADAARLELVIRNGSASAMGGGVVRLYAEDDAGRRHRVTEVWSALDAPVPGGEVPVGPVAPDEEIATVRFRPPVSTDRFVVVYVGDLGLEQRERPAGSPGAVVAKAITGGPRAEAIVPDAEEPVLRAAEGVFPLPTEAAGLELVQWGDLDNTFVGIVRGPDGDLAGEVRTFEIARPLGSPAIPLDDGGRLVAALTRSRAFPLGLPLGVEVVFRQSTRFRQVLTTFDTEAVYDDEVVTISLESSAPSLEIVEDQVIDFAGTYPIVLDEAHLVGAERGYRWSVLEVGLDRRGRPLALVQVDLDDPPLPSRELRLRKYDRDGNLAELDDPHVVHPRLPVPVSFLAVVDLERSEAIGATAGPVITVDYADDQAVGFVQQRMIAHGPGGTSVQWIDPRPVNPPEPADLPVVEAGELTALHRGPTRITVAGRFRGDLEPLVGGALGVTTDVGEHVEIYARDGVGDGQHYKAFRLRVPVSRVTGPLTLVNSALRMRPAADVEVLALFTRPAPATDGEEGVLVRWTPAGESRLALTAPLPPAFYALAGATTEAGLVTALDPATWEARTLLADLAADRLQPLGSGEVASAYVLLPPALLYGLEDTVFHATDDLEPTRLPVPLAPGPGAEAGEAAYHLVRAE